MSQTVVIELPDETVVRYQQGAVAARKPLEEYLLERLLQHELLPERIKSSYGRQPEAPVLSQREAELLKKINIGFSEEEWNAYRALIAKRREGTLQPGEQQALIHFSDRREQANAERIQALVALAEIRQTTLDALMAGLGIQSPGYE